MEVTKPNYTTSINDLNDYCFAQIFSYLDIADIKQVERVCPRWKGLCYEGWKAVGGLECIGSIWYLLGSKTDRKLYELTCINDLKESLMNCGRCIKYFRLSCRGENDGPIFASLLSTAPQYCMNLQCIELDSKESPSSEQIRTIANVCKRLTKITLLRVDRETEPDLSDLLEKSKHLKYIKLGVNLGKLSGDFFKHLSPDTIEEIHIPGCFELSQELFCTTVKKFKQLRVLNITQCCHIQNRGIAALAGLDKLESLSMCNLWKVTDDVVAMLPSSLKSLIAIGCAGLRDPGIIRLIEKAPELKLLDLAQCPITHVGVEGAINITKRRTNGVVLKMSICYMHSTENLLPNTSPYLHLHNPHNYPRIHHHRDPDL